MKNFVKNFLKGCLVLVPTAVTVYVVWQVGAWLGDLLPWFKPASLVFVVCVVALIGHFATNVVGRRLFGIFDRLLARVPLVKVVYTFVRDVMNALLGETRTFDRPVLVALSSDPRAPKIFGFITCDDLTDFGVTDHVAVYFPQSLNFAGNLLLFPTDCVHPVEADQKGLLTFVASGGMVRSKR